jgi:predicted patatin/cPLA2 family phospholipase
MTDAITGAQQIIRPTTNDELYQSVHASIRIPGLAGKPLGVLGGSFTDGAMSNPLPIKQLVRELAPTHVLVLPHRTSPVTEKIPLFETALNSVFYRSRIPSGLRQAIYNRKKVLLQELQWLRDKSSLPYVIAWSGGTIRRFERDAEKIKAAAFAAEMFWRKLLR